MANLIPVATDDAVPQIETTTLLLGGPGGPLNAQAQALINRMAFDRARFVSLTGSETLTNKTLTSPVLGGTVEMAATAITASANVTVTRAMGVAAAGTTAGRTELTNFSGDAGGTTDVRSFIAKTTLSGSSSVAQVNVHGTQLELTHTAGDVTFAYGDQSFIRLGRLGSTTGNVVTARGHEFHFANEGTGTIQTAMHYYAQDVDLIDGSGNIVDIYGFISGNYGHETRVTGVAIGHDAADMTAGNMTICAGFRSRITSGANRWGFLASGNANNAFGGNVRIGSTTAPTVALDVTGNSLVSGTLGVTGAITVTGGVITTGSTTAMSLRTTAGEMARIINVADVANVLQIEAAVAGGTVRLRPVGETNAGIHLHSSGTGSVLLGTNGGSGQVEVLSTASVNRRLTLTGSNGGNPTISTTGGNVAITPAVIGAASITAHGGTAIPTGGTAGAGFLLSSTANFGIFFGTGAPTLAAAQNSIYIRADGSSALTRLYSNTNGGTTWTPFTAGA